MSANTKSWLDHDPAIHAEACAELDREAEIQRLEKLLDGERREREYHWRYCLGCVVCNP